MESEIWKSHPEYTEIEVSTLGKVRTIDRVVPRGENGTRFLKGRVLKQYSDKDGYLKTSIPINGKRITKIVHRLVAQTFLSNPDNLPMINHKSCIRDDNRVENLEWCDASYNQKYREKHGVSQAEAQGHPVFAINLSTLNVSRYPSQIEVSRVLGFSVSNVNNVIKGKQNQTHGYWFVRDDGHAVDVVKSKLHDIGGVGLNIKYRKTLKTR